MHDPTIYLIWLDYTLYKSSEWYIVYICMLFQRVLIVDEFFLCFGLERIIKTNNFVFIHLKSSCHFQFIRKTMVSNAKWQLKQE